MPEDILISVPVPPETLPSLNLPSCDDSIKDLKSNETDAHYTGTIQRFFQSEVKPVYFGTLLKWESLFVYYCVY